MKEPMVSVPAWVVWTITLSLVGSSVTGAAAVIWGSSKAVSEIRYVRKDIESLKNDLRLGIEKLDSKVEKNTDRIFKMVDRLKGLVK